MRLCMRLQHLPEGLRRSQSCCEPFEAGRALQLHSALHDETWQMAGTHQHKDAGSPEKAATDLSGENKKLNKSQQLKQVFKQYGAVGVSFHVGISLISLGIFYVAVSSGVDMTPVLFKLGFSESSLQSKMAAGTSTFVLAYAIHKLFAPVRISITVVSVPFVVRYCRKIGFFKPPAPKP
uniref:Family with sequence similarity 210 member B n=1 Tax=Phasianus colchicus TaxID=9054 RepID=A0A669PF74_PHACC